MKFIFNWTFPQRRARAALCAAIVAGAAALDVPMSLVDAAPPGAAIDASAAGPASVERAELVMGSVARIALPAGSAPETFETAFAAMREVDRTMSLYRPDSALVRVNAHAARHPEPVDTAMFTLLARARELSVASDGAFDITVLPLLRLWGGYPELRYLGRGGNTTVGFAGLRLDPERRTVSFRRPGMGLDLGGIAKGFALDQARAALVAGGIRRARLDLGGNLAFVGTGPAASWRVAVRDPHTPDALLGVLTLGGDASVSTSGNYARDFAHEGWRAASHVFDPRTGAPAPPGLAVTVWAADATTADALSTALLVLGPEGASAVLARQIGAGALFTVNDGGGIPRTRVVGEPPIRWTTLQPPLPGEGST